MGSRRVPELERLIARVAAELRRRELAFMIIGGQAVLLHGRPRLTEDVDVTLAADPTELEKVLDVCGAIALEPLPSDAETFVRDTFVLPVRHAASGIRFDFIFSTTTYERTAIERAESVEMAGESVPFASAEDLLIHKLFAGRPTDLDDARGIARRKAGSIDWEYVERWAREFASIPGREEMPARVQDLKEAR